MTLATFLTAATAWTLGRHLARVCIARRAS